MFRKTSIFVRLGDRRKNASDAKFGFCFEIFRNKSYVLDVFLREEIDNFVTDFGWEA